jgi:molecular chaperone HtpG
VKTPSPLERRATETTRVDPDAIRIGKDIIEILTTGMYISPVTIYREYIQNAADSIDAARAAGFLGQGQRGNVSIAFDHATRSVTIRDNGAGIAAREALPILVAIGGSQKRGTNARGFRGVGRLSGLAYCRELEFRTKAAGEQKTTSVVWDCRALRERLTGGAFGGDLQRVIADVVTMSLERSGDQNDHFFEVRLKDIARLRNDLLLNDKQTAHYLAQVAPVPFSSEFSFAAQIEKCLTAAKRPLPINLKVAGEAVNRPYRNEMVAGTTHYLTIRDIEMVEFADVDGGAAAVGWIGHHDYVRSLPAGLGVRGLRARYGDIQVGESNLFEDTFKEARFNGWTVGELHVLDRRIVPNARRDNFEVNHHYYNLLVQLGPLAAKITQRCRSASVARNAAQIVRNVIAATTARLKERRSFDRAELSRLKSAVQSAGTKAKRIEDAATRRELETSLARLAKRLTKITPKRGASAVALDEATALVSKLVTNREQAQKLIQRLRKLCE